VAAIIWWHEECWASYDKKGRKEGEGEEEEKGRKKKRKKMP
jgi:hypothetical protein